MAGAGESAREMEVLSSLEPLMVFVPRASERMFVPRASERLSSRRREEFFEHEYSPEDEEIISNGPDLNGISKMIKMVGEDYTNVKIAEYLKNSAESSASVIIKRPSLLNPESKEFKPSTNVRNEQESSENELTDIETIKEHLKGVIVEANKGPDKNSSLILRQRNVAMASLQLLASTACSSSTSPQPKLSQKTSAIKLFTPEDFEKPAQPLVPLQKPDALPPTSQTSLPVPSVPSETEKVLANDRPEVSKYVGEWVQDPSRKREKRKIEKPKVDYLNLQEPSWFAFGPKVQNNKSSSTEPSSSFTPISMPPNRSSSTTGNEWVPPLLVQELHMQYSKDFKKQEEKKLQFENQWTKLERQLKENDAIILKKQLDKLNSSVRS